MTNPNQVNDVPPATQSEGVGEVLVNQNAKMRLSIEQAIYSLKTDIAGMRNDLGFYNKDFREGVRWALPKMKSTLRQLQRNLPADLEGSTAPASERNRENEPKASEATKNPLNKER